MLQRWVRASEDEAPIPRLSACRGYLDRSFDTIAGYGPNAAIIHYVAQAGCESIFETCSKIVLLDQADSAATVGRKLRPPSFSTRGLQQEPEDR